MTEDTIQPNIFKEKRYDGIDSGCSYESESLEWTDTGSSPGKNNRKKSKRRKSLGHCSEDLRVREHKTEHEEQELIYCLLHRETPNSSLNSQNLQEFTLGELKSKGSDRENLEGSTELEADPHKHKKRHRKDKDVCLGSASACTETLQQSLSPQQRKRQSECSNRNIGDSDDFEADIHVYDQPKKKRKKQGRENYESVEEETSSVGNVRDCLSEEFENDSSVHADFKERSSENWKTKKKKKHKHRQKENLHLEHSTQSSCEEAVVDSEEENVTNSCTQLENQSVFSGQKLQKKKKKKDKEKLLEQSSASDAIHEKRQRRVMDNVLEQSTYTSHSGHEKRRKKDKKNICEELPFTSETGHKEKTNKHKEKRNKSKENFLELSLCMSDTEQQKKKEDSRSIIEQYSISGTGHKKRRKKKDKEKLVEQPPDTLNKLHRKKKDKENSSEQSSSSETMHKGKEKDMNILELSSYSSDRVHKKKKKDKENICEQSSTSDTRHKKKKKDKENICEQASTSDKPHKKKKKDKEKICEQSSTTSDTRHKKNKKDKENICEQSSTSDTRHKKKKKDKENICEQSSPTSDTDYINSRLEDENMRSKRKHKKKKTLGDDLDVITEIRKLWDVTVNKDNHEEDTAINSNDTAGTENRNDGEGVEETTGTIVLVKKTDMFVSPELDSIIHSKNRVLGSGSYERPMKADLEAKGIFLRTGHWSKAENEHLQANWEQYLKEHPVEEPYSLLDRKDYSIREQKEIRARQRDTTFHQKLARGLNRSTYSCYIRARRMFHPGYRGSFTDEEFRQLQKLKKSYGNRWTEIGKKMDRAGGSLYSVNRRREKKTKSGEWSRNEEKLLIQAIQKEMGTENLSSLYRQIPWNRVNKHVPNRSSPQCREHWIKKLAWTVNSEEKRIRWGKKNRLLLVKTIYELDVFDESEIDWDELFTQFEDVESPQQLQKRWFWLKSSVHDYHRKTFDEIRTHLYTSFGEPEYLLSCGHWV